MKLNAHVRSLVIAASLIVQSKAALAFVPTIDGSTTLPFDTKISMNSGDSVNMLVQNSSGQQLFDSSGNELVVTFTLTKYDSSGVPVVGAAATGIGNFEVREANNIRLFMDGVTLTELERISTTATFSAPLYSTDHPDAISPGGTRLAARLGTLNGFGIADPNGDPTLDQIFENYSATSPQITSLGVSNEFGASTVSSAGSTLQHVANGFDVIGGAGLSGAAIAETQGDGLYPSVSITEFDLSLTALSDRNSGTNLSVITASRSFQMSFDGALIPEPSSSMLGGLSVLLLLVQRKRISR